MIFTTHAAFDHKTSLLQFPASCTVRRGSYFKTLMSRPFGDIYFSYGCCYFIVTQQFPDNPGIFNSKAFIHLINYVYLSTSLFSFLAIALHIFMCYLSCLLYVFSWRNTNLLKEIQFLI